MLRWNAYTEKKLQRQVVILIAILLSIFIAGLLCGVEPAFAAGKTVKVSSAAQLAGALEKASTSKASPTNIILNKSITMPAGQPVEAKAGTYVTIKGAKKGVKLMAASDWNATGGAITADSVPALVQVSGTLTIQDLTVTTSKAASGVRCIGVTSTGNLTLANTSVTGSKLTRAGGLGIYTLGKVTMNKGAYVEKIKAATSTTITGVGVCIGYDRATKAHGSLTMNSGSAVRNNASTKQNGARLSGIGIYNQGALAIKKGAAVSGNTAVYADHGVGIYVEGGSAASKATLKLAGGTISGNKENGSAQGMYGTQGGGVCLYNNATMTMTSGTISGNLARDGGGGLLLCGRLNCKATLSGGSIQSNRAYADGAGILVAETNAQLILQKKITIKNNINKFDSKEAKKNKLTNTNGYHEGNGGGIYNAGTLTMKGGTITGNTAASTMADSGYVYGQGGGIFNEGSLTMRGGTIKGNKATTSAKGGKTSGSGGGIAIRGGDTPGEVTLLGGTIKSNTAKGKGGDVWINDSDSRYNMLSRTVEYAANQGILHLSGPSKETLKLTVGSLGLAENTVFFVAGTLVGSNIRIASADTANGTIIGESDDYSPLIADAQALKNTKGKRVYTVKNERIVIGKAAASDASRTDISKASVSGIGNATYAGEAQRPEPAVTLGGKKLTRDKDYQLAWFNNINASTDSKPAKVKIYGIGSYKGTITKTFRIQPCDLSGGQIQPMRERLYTGEAVEPVPKVLAGSLQLTAGRDFETSYENNIETGTAALQITGKGNYTGTLAGSFQIVPREGRAIAADAQTLKQLMSSGASPIYISGSIALRETIPVGSGADIELIGENESASITAGGTITDGDASGPSLLTVSGHLTVEDLIIDAGGAAQTRAIRIAGSGRFTLGAGAVLTGGSGILGRAVYNAGSLELTGGSISGNNAAFGTNTACGTIYSTGTVTQTAGIIDHNLAVKGGGIYVAAGRAELTGGSIQSNSVSGAVDNQPYSSYGGGLYVEEGAAAVLGPDLKITDNSAGQYGGGIASFGQLTIDGARITGNTAVLGGGGILTGGQTSQNSGSIDGNALSTDAFAQADIQTGRHLCYAAANGGGVYVQGGTFTLHGGNISGNTARSRYNSSTGYADMGNGGGVYISANGGDAGAPAKFLMTGGSISGNTAKSDNIHGSVLGNGGGVYAMGGSDSQDGYAPGQFTMAGGIIADNQASEAGDDVYLADSFQMRKDKAKVPTEYAGKAQMALSGPATISGSSADGLYLAKGMQVQVTGPLSGQIRVTAQVGQQAVIALPGGSYTLTDGDAAAFANTTAIRAAQLDGGEIALVPQKDLRDVCTLTLSGKNPGTYEYTGKNVRPTVTVTNADTDKKLGKTNYTVSYDRTKSIEPRTYQLTVTGAGAYREYGGSLTASYRVVPVNISKATAKKIPDQKYTGKAIEYWPKTGDIKYQGQTLLRGEDYTITWKNNKKVGKATLIYIGQGHFTGQKRVTFNIVKK